MSHIISESVQDTLHAGASLAKCLRPGDILCLFGEFGAGKTVFTKGLARGLGIPSDAVVSPSFVLIKVHTRGRLPLAHFDLYRLEQVGDIAALGVDEYLYGQGVSVIEWAQHFGTLLPAQRLEVHFRAAGGHPDRRRLEFRGVGVRYKELESCFRRHLRAGKSLHR